MQDKRVAALFVLPDGPYSTIDYVDCWDEERDARLYDGSLPVVAHPPCSRWGRYWHGGPSAKVRRIKGDDAGCFAAALAAVRRCGGILEHPQASHAWTAFGINRPPYRGGWIAADLLGGWTCQVEQGHYGHRARKATWLYAFGVSELPELKWGPALNCSRLDDGFHSAEERRANPHRVGRNRLTQRECLETPRPFMELLLALAQKQKQPAG